ncbi:radical SAM protein [Bacillus sp. HMF5848]|uniref:radical SAM protein n=1 Tax=Bacillus sp. HMF5848 TaxID=2495421 RepID=UPI000F7933CA|nr:radical SAM protein [Bacillus sp. HMF5848]RSK27558.1 radical SAM protein [Bacillus sp. HMF5848]
MLKELSIENIHEVTNPILQHHARLYMNIHDDFMKQVKMTGIDLEQDKVEDIKSIKQRLKEKGATFRNDDKSIVVNEISSACEACQTGVGSVTSIISLKCHKKCFYCFNPNQENYDMFSVVKSDPTKELEAMFQSGKKISHVALTGGEPLLHKQEMLHFFKYVKDKSMKIHTRLYTSGDFLDENTAKQLHEIGLDEIRFSIKMEHTLDKCRYILEKISLAKQYIPDVMVEMPVIPGTLNDMKELLIELDELNIYGINLLEFCFPYTNVEEFSKRAFKVKTPPFKVLYNYWYAGGLPIQNSEWEALKLMEFAMDQGLKLGIHYCSLENKHTGQVYQQNYPLKHDSIYKFSKRDYFLKSAKVFGEDIPRAKEIFKKRNIFLYEENEEFGYLEFHINNIQALKGLSIDVGLSYNVVETRDGDQFIRELKMDLTTPDTFNIKEDV